MRMISRQIALLIALLLACGVAHAQVVEANTIGKGEGLTRIDAVQSALIEAIGQAFGVSLSAVTTSKSVAQRTITNSSEDLQFLDQFNKQVVQKVKTPTQNPILNYRVLNAKEVRPGFWNATVRMTYAKYQAIGAPSKRYSAVVVSPQTELKSMLLRLVNDALVGSRRFDVLNRDHADLFDEEKNFIISDDAASKEIARLGQALGSDYMVIVELQNLEITENVRETIRLTGEVLVNSYVSGELSLKVIEFSSRKLKWSGSDHFSGDFPNITSVGERELVALISSSSKTIVAKMVAAIYPIQVIKVISANMAAVSRGEGSVKVGDEFAVFLMGEDMRDPQNGESLGALELEMGRGKIINVTPKYSVIKTDGEIFEARGDYILRAVEQ